MVFPLVIHVLYSFDICASLGADIRATCQQMQYHSFPPMKQLKSFLESYTDHKTYESYRKHEKRCTVPTVGLAWHIRILEVKCSIIAKVCHSKDAYMLLMLDLKFLVFDYLINPLKQRVLKFPTTFCVIKGGISLSV